MQESFLWYIWQLQYFEKKDLRTAQGDALQVIRPGVQNTHAGPDFVNAKVRIGPMHWAGTIEIHVKSSEWYVHQHHLDKAYDSVVLHVVWLNDQPIVYEDGTVMPTLELKARIEQSLILQYRKLVQSSFSIPCSRNLPRVPEITKLSMLDKASVQRLEKKSLEILRLFELNKHDWEETTYQLLARNFGFKVNADPFFQLARALPSRLLVKHADHPIQVEALMFGQAGFLEMNVGDPYYKLLQKEYRFLCRKYSLAALRLKAAQWKFLRMRPANFPTIRLAQFCTMMSNERHIFSRIIEVRSYDAMTALFGAAQNEYWRTHYTFGKKVRTRISKLGTSSVENVIINTVAPLLAAYGKINDDPSVVDRAENFLHHIPAEANGILAMWERLEWSVRSAFDSQALIELYTSYCVPRRCLQCAIGASIVKPA